jgi:hypothetical protein
VRDYWYKVIIPVPDLLAKGLFMELFDDDPDLPEVRLVNAHEQKYPAKKTFSVEMQ